MLAVGYNTNECPVQQPGFPVRDQIAQFLTQLATERTRSTRTVAAYQADLAQFVDFVEQQSAPAIHDWATVTPALLADYRTTLQTQQPDYRLSTVTRKIAAVKSFFAYLLQTGVIPANPAQSLSITKAARQTPPTISKAEMLRLLQAPQGQQTAPTLRDKALLELLCATGLQITELINLNVGDLDLANQCLACAATTKRARTLPLYPRTIAALLAYVNEGRQDLLRDRSEPALWLNLRGERLTRQGLWLIVKRYVAQAGIALKVTPQILRHNFAIHQLQAGASLQTVRRRLGHARLSSTRVYTQAVNQGVAELEIDSVPFYQNRK